MLPASAAPRRSYHAFEPPLIALRSTRLIALPHDLNPRHTPTARQGKSPRTLLSALHHAAERQELSNVTNLLHFALLLHDHYVSRPGCRYGSLIRISDTFM